MKDHFKNHVLTEVNDHTWIWQIPENITYRMGFTIFINRVIIIGDFGDWVFCPGTNREKQFLLGADNRDYFWEKLSNKPHLTKKEEEAQLKFFNMMFDGLEAFREQYWKEHPEE